MTKVYEPDIEIDEVLSGFYFVEFHAFDSLLEPDTFWNKFLIILK